MKPFEGVSWGDAANMSQPEVSRRLLISRGMREKMVLTDLVDECMCENIIIIDLFPQKKRAAGVLSVIHKERRNFGNIQLPHKPCNGKKKPSTNLNLSEKT